MSGPDQIREERQRALRTLLLRPLITSRGEDAEVLQLIRRHSEHLREWLLRNVDWSLTVESELARLRKIPGTLLDRTRPAVDHTSKQPFTRSRYVVFCLALAALERSERQTTLGKLAEEVGRLHAAEPAFGETGLWQDLSTQDSRRDLVHAIRLLLSLGVVVRVHGDEQQFLQSQGDVLYTINRPAMAVVLSTRRPPSMVSGATLPERLRALVEEPFLESDDARNRTLRIGLTRRLLDDPILYYADLTEEERAYLTHQRAHLIRQVEEATGLVAEIRQEGIALVDEGGQLTDYGIPEEGTEGHLALLMAELLATAAREHPGMVVPREVLVARVSKLMTQYGEYWRKDARVAGAEEQLTDETIYRLEALGLVQVSAEGVLPRAAVGRFALVGPGRRAELIPRAGSQA